MREERKKRGARKAPSRLTSARKPRTPRPRARDPPRTALAGAPFTRGSLARARVAVGRIACQTRDSIPSLRKLLTQPRARAEVCTVTLWAQSVSRLCRPAKACTARNPPTRRSLCGPSKARSPARLAGPVPQLCTEGRAHAASRLPASSALKKGAVVRLSSSPFAA